MTLHKGLFKDYLKGYLRDIYGLFKGLPWLGNI